jgi:protease I
MTSEGSQGRVVVLAEEGYQELEFWYPVMRLREEGVEVVTAALQNVKAYESRLGYPLLAEVTIEDLDPATIRVLIVPGDEAGRRLAGLKMAVDLVREVSERGGAIAAIATGVDVLGEAGILKGRRVGVDEANASSIVDFGGIAVNEEVVVDGNLITSRGPDDLPAFVRTILLTLQSKAKGEH